MTKRSDPAIFHNRIDHRRDHEATGKVTKRGAFQKVCRACVEVKEDNDDVALFNPVFRHIVSRAIDHGFQTLHFFVEHAYRTMVDDHTAFVGQRNLVAIEEQHLIFE